MPDSSNVAGLAALSVCESILLSLVDNNIIDEAEANAILNDAATTHHEAALMESDVPGNHAEATALLDSIIENGNSVRHADR